MSDLPDKFHFAPPEPVDQAELRRRVWMAEKLIAMMPDPGHMHVEHYFAGGVYGRALYIPKGCFLTGKLHKYPQINVLVSGDITVMTESGPKRATPPFVVVSPGGTKRIAYANEDTIWMTFFATPDTDVEKIENHFVAETEQEYLDHVAQQQGDSS